MPLSQRCSVVELIAAGCVTIAHNSGGPKTDIIGPQEVGFLASTSDDYARLMATTFQHWDSSNLQTMRLRGRKSMRRFDDHVFIKEFLEVLMN